MLEGCEEEHRTAFYGYCYEMVDLELRGLNIMPVSFSTCGSSRLQRMSEPKVKELGA